MSAFSHKSCFLFCILKKFNKILGIKFFSRNQIETNCFEKSLNKFISLSMIISIYLRNKKSLTGRATEHSISLHHHCINECNNFNSIKKVPKKSTSLVGDTLSDLNSKASTNILSKGNKQLLTSKAK